MKSVLVFIIYIVGFVFFYQVMSYFEVDKHWLFFLDNDTATATVSNNNSKSTQKEGDIWTPSDAKKPLSLTKQEIGRHAWNLLHSMGAAFPANPSEDDKKEMINFINGLAHNFPCKVCSKHFVKIWNEHPIKCNSREELVLYWCDIHNIVNKFLKKPIFDCQKAFDIWGGDCGCEA